MTKPANRVTGAEFLAHWKKMADEGRLNFNTALALQTAIRHVFSSRPGWENQNVNALTDAQIEDLLRRFETRARQENFQQKTIGEYQRRFRQAINWLRQYLKDPRGWKAQTSRPVPRPRKRAALPGAGKPAALPAQVARAVSKPAVAKSEAAMVMEAAISSVDYPFPIRPGVVARLNLPTDLTRSEVRRLASFLQALAVDAEPSQQQGN